MDDRTKRQMRLTNTMWFNLINYTNFTLYFTRIDKLPEITERLSKYNRPIGAKFVKSFISKSEQWIAHLSKLTNLTSLSFQGSDYKDVSIDDWMKLTALSNLESWPVPYFCPDRVIAKLFNLRELHVQGSHSWAVYRGELSKFTNLISLNVAHNSTIQDLDLSILPHKLTRLDISATVSGQGISKLTNLKSLAYRQQNGTPKEPFPFSQLSRLEILTLNQQDLLDVTHFPKNITNLTIAGNNITPDCRAGLAKLDKLKSINIGVIAPDSAHDYLTVMTALTDVSFWAPIDAALNQPWQNITGACLSYLRSDKLDSLTLGLTPFTTNLEHLSQLTTVENLFLYEEGASQADIDYSSICGMTKLTNLMVYASISRPSLLCLTDLVSLKLLVVDTSEGDDVTFDDRLILTRLTDLVDLSLNGCTRATVESLSLCTNLQGIQMPLMFPNVDYSFLATMKLTSLSVLNAIEDSESFWNALPKMTGLSSLDLRGVTSDEEKIIRLTSLLHLTQLCIRNSDKFKGEHVTVLTTLQRLTVGSRAAKGYLTQEELSKRMPYLTFVSLYCL